MLLFSVNNQNICNTSEMHLSSGNRWVRYAQHLPWDELKRSFPDLLADFQPVFPDPLRTALACRLIQMQYNVSDEELLLMVQENPYLQYFCGFSDYDSENDRIGPDFLKQFSLIPEDVLSEIIHLCSRALKGNA